MSADARSNRCPRRLLAVAVVGCCAVFTLLVLQHARSTCATYDETTHLPSGYSYLKWDDYRLNPVHPPLVKKLAALPLLTLRLIPEDIELTARELRQTGSHDTVAALKTAWALSFNEKDAEWFFGHYFLYGVKPEVLAQLGANSPLEAPTAIQDAHGGWRAPLSKGDFINDADELLFRGRVPMALLGVALALLIFCWTRELFGNAGALLALALFCFDPNFIAHSGLVTTDVGLTLFMFGAIYFFWRACRRLEAANAALTAAFAALAVVTKFSSLLLLPMFVLLAAVKIFSPGQWQLGFGRAAAATRRAKLLAFIVLAAVTAATSVVVIWMMYGWRFSAAKNPETAARLELLLRPQEPRGESRQAGRLPLQEALRHSAALRQASRQWDWRQFPDGPTEETVRAAAQRTALGLRARIILWAARFRLLPEAYLYGIANVEERGILHQSYLRGEYSKTGFRSYFLWTFLLKTPLPTLLALAGAVALVCARRQWLGAHLAFLLIPVAVYGASAVAAPLNIGHRHLLPIYPFLFVLSGVLAVPWRHCKPPLKVWSAALALGWIVWSSFFVFAPFAKGRHWWKPDVVYPHYLSYFNELAGGPRCGHLSLADSNLDWGQDLKHLRRWLDQKRLRQPVALCYFGMADPRYHGIAHVTMPGGYAFAPPLPPQPRRFEDAPRPGYLVISATHLQGATWEAAERKMWRDFLKDATLVDRIGYSLFIYQLDAPP